MQEMTPMAERQSSVDLVKDSSVGGICWAGGGEVFRFALISLQLTIFAVPGRWYWYQLRTCLGSVPEGWCQRTWEENSQMSVTLSLLWHLEDEERQDVDRKQISLRLGGATWWGRGWSCSAGCGAGLWPKKDPETPLWARWWGTTRSLQRTGRWRPDSRGRPVTIATHERSQWGSYSATHQETLISSVTEALKAWKTHLFPYEPHSHCLEYFI